MIGRRLVAAHVVRVLRSVDAHDGFREREVTLVLDDVRRRVVVVVPAVAVLAPPVKVLHAQVQPLPTTDAFFVLPCFIQRN